MRVLEGALGWGRKAGHALFYLTMAVCTLVGIGVGMASAQDARDGQPVVWGTFTEQDCEPVYRGCRSVGTWVSDDRTMVKERIYLDGSPGSDGTVRASFQADGLMNDTDNNIVHTADPLRAALWFPWVASAACVGITVYYARKWARERNA